MRAIKRRWTEAEYAALVEFSTGYGPRSGGKRRPHWNLLIKGVPAADLDELREVVCRVWCSRVDATPAGQFAGAVNEAGGLMRYLALHFQKESQRPPEGWSGHRFRVSNGYLAGSMVEARARARAALRWKRELWRALKEGHTGEAAEVIAESRSLARAAVSWELVHVDLRMSLKRALSTRPAPAPPEGAEGHGERVTAIP